LNPPWGSFDGELVDGLPGSVERGGCLVGLAGPRADLGVDGVCAGSNGVAGAPMGIDGCGAGDLAGCIHIIGCVQGHHGVAGLNGGPVASVGESLCLPVVAYAIAAALHAKSTHRRRSQWRQSHAEQRRTALGESDS
jgi:hypothetical protein